jgi:hypothetical protein
VADEVGAAGQVIGDQLCFPLKVEGRLRWDWADSQDG